MTREGLYILYIYFYYYDLLGLFSHFNQLYGFSHLRYALSKVHGYLNPCHCRLKGGRLGIRAVNHKGSQNTKGVSN